MADDNNGNDGGYGNDVSNGGDPVGDDVGSIDTFDANTGGSPGPMGAPGDNFEVTGGSYAIDGTTNGLSASLDFGVPVEGPPAIVENPNIEPLAPTATTTQVGSVVAGVLGPAALAAINLAAGTPQGIAAATVLGTMAVTNAALNSPGVAAVTRDAHSVMDTPGAFSAISIDVAGDFGAAGGAVTPAAPYSINEGGGIIDNFSGAGVLLSQTVDPAWLAGSSGSQGG